MLRLKTVVMIDNDDEWLKGFHDEERLLVQWFYLKWIFNGVIYVWIEGVSNGWITTGDVCLFIWGNIFYVVILFIVFLKYSFKIVFYLKVGLKLNLMECSVMWWRGWWKRMMFCKVVCELNCFSNERSEKEKCFRL